MFPLSLPYKIGVIIHNSTMKRDFRLPVGIAQ